MVISKRRSKIPEGTICYFCKQVVGKNNRPEEHHIYGRNVSNARVWVHRKCHRAHHKDSPPYPSKNKIDVMPWIKDRN